MDNSELFKFVQDLYNNQYPRISTLEDKVKRLEEWTKAPWRQVITPQKVETFPPDDAIPVNDAFVGRQVEDAVLWEYAGFGIRIGKGGLVFYTPSQKCCPYEEWPDKLFWFIKGVERG